MHREHPTSQNTRNIATVAYNLGFDLAVVDVVGEQKTVLTCQVNGKRRYR
jgi:hypothetical protein